MYIDNFLLNMELQKCPSNVLSIEIILYLLSYI